MIAVSAIMTTLRVTFRNDTQRPPTNELSSGKPDGFRFIAASMCAAEPFPADILTSLVVKRSGASRTMPLQTGVWDRCVRPLIRPAATFSRQREKGRNGRHTVPETELSFIQFTSASESGILPHTRRVTLHRHRPPKPERMTLPACQVGCRLPGRVVP